MPSNTSYRPNSISAFDADKIQSNARGVRNGSLTLNTTTDLDLYFADDHLITGFWIFGSNITDGDSVVLQVIDTDNIFGYGAGTVLKSFMDLNNPVYLPGGSFREQFDMVYPAKILTGLSLRLKYTSTATSGTNPSFTVNYKTHKVLA